MPAQLLLAQPHRRLSLSLNWWNSGFILSDREESLSPWGITPADFLFFLANEETTSLVGVRKLLLSHLPDCMCVGAQQPTSLWKMAEMGCKNRRYPKSWNMSCSFSLIWAFCLKDWTDCASCPLPFALSGAQAEPRLGAVSCLSLGAGPAGVTLKSSSSKRVKTEKSLSRWD